MVNLRNVSKYTGEVPTTKKADRKIKGEPLYNLDDVLGILGTKDSTKLVPWTRKCVKDLQKLGYESVDAIDFLLTHLISRNYKCSEWCEQKPEGPWAACDVYFVRHKEKPKHANIEMIMETYIKLAINKLGTVILLISFHPSEDK